MILDSSPTNEGIGNETEINETPFLNRRGGVLYLKMMMQRINSEVTKPKTNENLYEANIE
ncbi:MAG: hypothetical protein C4576_08755 [Desulfobacteraceae bacterium]|nr:MAG: hypothetical protein C4576_08755 [Desulfobacteraceae bacterium]